MHGLRDGALDAAAAAGSSAALDSIDVEVLGKKGSLTGVLRGIGALPAEDRPRVGAVANEVRTTIEAALAARGATLRAAELTARLAAETVDPTTPGRPVRRGTLHPIIETMGRIAEIFGRFGFIVHEGPEVEDDLTNFQMLNIAPDLSLIHI